MQRILNSLFLGISLAGQSTPTKMAPSFHAVLRIFILFFSVNSFTFALREKREGIFFDHVQNERLKSDTKSPPFQRETLLYSRSSRAHLRIIGRRIDGLGSDDDKYAKLVVESDNFGRVRIRSAATDYYLCIKKNGRFVGRKGTKSNKCVFYEKYAANSCTEFVSAFKQQWMIAVSKKGHMRPGYKGRKGRKTVQFIERASKIIIQTFDVEESLVRGLKEHIEKLLRNYRKKEENHQGTKMPHPGLPRKLRGKKSRKNKRLYRSKKKQHKKKAQ